MKGMKKGIATTIGTPFWKHGDKSHSLYLGAAEKVTAEEAEARWEAFKPQR